MATSTVAAPQAATPLFKALASSSTTRRRQAMASIRTYLSTKRNLTHGDYLKIWKALFYCLYMTPKMRLQQRLSIEISELVEVVAGNGRDGDEEGEEEEEEGERKREGAGQEGGGGRRRGGGGRSRRRGGETQRQKTSQRLMSFVSAFWQTMSREWSGIDKARLDKFMFLVRRMVYASLLACRRDESNGDNGEEEKGKKDEKKEEKDEKEEEMEEGEHERQQSYTWDPSLLAETLKTLQAIPLDARNAQIPTGLRLHVLDVLLDEVERADPAVVGQGPSSGSIVVDAVLGVVRSLERETLTKTVRERAREVLGDERVVQWMHGAGRLGCSGARGGGDGEGEDKDESEEEWGGIT